MYLINIINTCLVIIAFIIPPIVIYIILLDEIKKWKDKLKQDRKEDKNEF